MALGLRTAVKTNTLPTDLTKHPKSIGRVRLVTDEWHARNGCDYVLFGLVEAEHRERQSSHVAPVNKSNASPIESHVQLLDGVYYHTLDDFESVLTDTTGTVQSNHQIDNTAATCTDEHIITIITIMKSNQLKVLIQYNALIHVLNYCFDHEIQQKISDTRIKISIFARVAYTICQNVPDCHHQLSKTTGDKNSSSDNHNQKIF